MPDDANDNKATEQTQLTLFPTDNELREALAERTQVASDLADQLRARDAQLEDMRERTTRLERRNGIERGLALAGAIDSEALALLVENARASGDRRALMKILRLRRNT